MFRTRISVGRVLGIHLWLHWSWFPVLAFVTWVTTADFAILYPRIGRPERLMMGIATGLAFFVCLATHEMAHALVARRFGVRVRGITLFLFGGVAEIQGEVTTPAKEFAVALAGPATSIAIGSAMGLFSILAARQGWSALEGVSLTLALVNAGVAIFNLLPGLPLDGGRLLRAGLWRATGSYERATKIAAAGGGVFACVIVVLGLVLAATGTPAGLWYLPMGVFLWKLARAASKGRSPRADGALAFDHLDEPTSQPTG